MQLPIIIHKEDNSDFGVTIPDLPGVFASGATLEEALEDAREAIFLRFCDDKKCVLPHPTSIAVLRANMAVDDDGIVEMLDINETFIAHESALNRS